jgi:integrase
MPMKWEKTRKNYLFRLQPSGTYYVRRRIGSKTLRQSLKTSNYDSAVVALDAWLEKHKEPVIPTGNSWPSLVERYLLKIRARVERGTRAERTLDYKTELTRKFVGTFPVRAIQATRKTDVDAWLLQDNLYKGATRMNGLQTVFRELCRMAVDESILARNHELCDALEHYKVTLRQPYTPTDGEIKALKLEIYRRSALGGRGAEAQEGGFLFEFLLYSGLRIGSIPHVLWSDIEAEVIHVRVAKRGAYHTPIHAAMRELLERIKIRRGGSVGRDDRVILTSRLDRVLRTSCAALGLKRINHHTLRHIYATRCIEAGVDIPTIASWLGHKDGGALLMRVYGHQRKAHTLAMVAKVKF